MGKQEERLKHSYESWKTEDLMKAVTIDKAQYEPTATDLMIQEIKKRNLGDDDIEKFPETYSRQIIEPEHAERLGRILDRLNAASEIRDMNYPGSSLHKLAGDKKDQYAVKVSGNWRVFFEFVNGDATSSITTIITER